MTTIQTAAARTVTGPTRVQAVAATVVASLLGNLAVYGVGIAAGGSFDLTRDGTTAHVSAATVAGMTVVPLLVGMVLAALLSLRWLGVVRAAQVVGAALSLATIGGTVAADFDAVSTVTLAAMHVVIAAAIVVGLGAMRRRIVA